MITKIISGGQTGVDRAALDVAIALSIPHGGWCPKGRRAENNTTIEAKYQLQETQSREFSKRTEKNIEDSDGTLVITTKPLSDITDGTILTIAVAKRINKPLLIIELSHLHQLKIATISNWLNENNIKILNIAGPRESQNPGIYDDCFKFLYDFISGLKK